MESWPHSVDYPSNNYSAKLEYKEKKNEHNKPRVQVSTSSSAVDRSRVGDRRVRDPFQLRMDLWLRENNMRLRDDELPSAESANNHGDYDVSEPLVARKFWIEGSKI